MERAELERLVLATGAAVRHGGLVFLCDPHWTATQREAFDQLVQSQVTNDAAELAEGWLCIATGGSSGALRFARHDEGTFDAAVRGFCVHFSLPTVNVIDVLPPWHVSGLLARVRCAATGGQHLPWDWKQLETGAFPALSAGKDWVLSLVPTQLQRLLNQPLTLSWLRGLKIIFIGGGPVWPELVDAAVREELPIVLSYGMTETAAMVVAQTPTECAAGDRSSGRAMPHARIQICDETTGEILGAGQTGLIRIEGDSVMRGYVGSDPVAGSFSPEDLGWLDERGRLHVAGRRDDVIITGGEKVAPRAVEAVLRATGWFGDMAIVGLPHPEWGEVVVACYVPSDDAFDPRVNGLELDRQLTRHQRPKHWVRFNATDWPRNAQGKVNRSALIEAAISALRNPRG